MLYIDFAKEAPGAHVVDNVCSQVKGDVFGWELHFANVFIDRFTMGLAEIHEESDGPIRFGLST